MRTSFVPIALAQLLAGLWTRLGGRAVALPTRLRRPGLRVLRAGCIASVAWCVGCSDASGNLIGGEAIYDAATSVVSVADTGGGPVTSACPSDGGTTGWQDLYGCYFQTCGSATCHSSPGDEGAVTSGFVCGTTAASCFTGITSTSISAFPALVTPGGVSDATSTPLWAALYKGGNEAAASNNMPLSPIYMFTAGDLVSIQTWIQGGAQNN